MSNHVQLCPIFLQYPGVLIVSFNILLSCYFFFALVANGSERCDKVCESCVEPAGWLTGDTPSTVLHSTAQYWPVLQYESPRKRVQTSLRLTGDHAEQAESGVTTVRKPFQLLEYQKWIGGGFFWHSGEIGLCRPSELRNVTDMMDISVKNICCLG